MYKIGDVITKQIYDREENIWEKSKKNSENNKNIHGNVFFTPSSKVSRREFKKSYPNCKIVRDLSKADTVIVPNYLIFPWMPFPVSGFKLVEIKMEKHPWNNREYTSSDSIRSREFIFVTSLKEKNIVFDKNVELFVENDEEIPDEMCERITQLLSGDKESIDLGLSILFQYNHLKNTDKFLLILVKAKAKAWYSRKKSRVTENKLIQIKKNYPNLNF